MTDPVVSLELLSVGNVVQIKTVKRPRRYAVHFDGHAPAEVLADRQTLEYWLRKVAETAGMTILSTQVQNVGAEVYGKPASELELDSGWSVLALITTSHISVHTWPAHGCFMADIVSCRRFSPQAILHVSRDILRYTNLNVLYEHPEGNDNELC